MFLWVLCKKKSEIWTVVKSKASVKKSQSTLDFRKMKLESQYHEFGSVWFCLFLTHLVRYLIEEIGNYISEGINTFRWITPTTNIHILHSQEMCNVIVEQENLSNLGLIRTLGRLSPGMQWRRQRWTPMCKKWCLQLVTDSEATHNRPGSAFHPLPDLSIRQRLFMENLWFTKNGRFIF